MNWRRRHRATKSWTWPTIKRFLRARVYAVRSEQTGPDLPNWAFRRLLCPLRAALRWFQELLFRRCLRWAPTTGDRVCAAGAPITVVEERGRTSGFLAARKPGTECTSPVDRCVRGCRLTDPKCPNEHVVIIHCCFNSTIPWHCTLLGDTEWVWK